MYPLCDTLLGKDEVLITVNNFDLDLDEENISILFYSILFYSFLFYSQQQRGVVFVLTILKGGVCQHTD
jgi:hypothetical protein